MELAGGPLLLPANPRMNASPLPVFVHVLSAVPYAVLGAFQFSSRLRRRHPRWHRSPGRLVVALGLLVALSGLWMTLFYARQPGTGELGTSSGWPSARPWPPASCSASRRSAAATSPTHRAWMTRAYAIALAAATQMFTLGVGPALFGPGALTKDLSLGAGWVINLAVAEVVIHRYARPRVPAAPHRVGTP